MVVRDWQLPLTHRDLTLLTSRSRPFSSPAWLFELKYDGYRALALRGDEVRLISRQGRDLTSAFPEVVAALLEVQPGTALDCELVILDAEGRPQFDPLARAWRLTASAIAEAARTKPATLIAFDILFHNGIDVRPLPIERRKKMLADAAPSKPHLMTDAWISASLSSSMPRIRTIHFGARVRAAMSTSSRQSERPRREETETSTDSGNARRR